METKQCWRCKAVHPLTNFDKNRSKRNGHSDECKPCRNILCKEYYRKNRRLQIDRGRDCLLKRKYGISLEQYKNMLVNQSDCCAICKRPERTKGFSLSIDHCHATGKIRGLLCQKCNRAVGLLDDNASLMESAATYLRQ